MIMLCWRIYVMLAKRAMPNYKLSGTNRMFDLVCCPGFKFTYRVWKVCQLRVPVEVGYRRTLSSLLERHY